MRRPRILILLALIHFLAPFAEVIAQAVLHGESLPTILLSSWQRQTLLSWMDATLTLPLAGAIILAARSWSYGVFVALMGWETYANFQTWKAYPELIQLSTLVTIYAVDVGIVGYFLAPFTGRSRREADSPNWVTRPRFDVALPAKLETPKGRRRCKIVNLSEGGAFVRTGRSIREKDVVLLEFKLGNTSFSIEATPVYRLWKGMKGYGVQFVHTLESRAALRKALADPEVRARLKAERGDGTDMLSRITNLILEDVREDSDDGVA